jgi:dienelactone hydrolase
MPTPTSRRLWTSCGHEGSWGRWWPGGSYSAALTIRLAAEHGDELAAALAFSPASGEPLRGCRPEQFADAIEIPVLVLRPDREMEIEWVSGQMLKLGRAGLETFVAASEGHGSSILVTERAGADPILTWETVLRFLRVATAPDVRPREVELQSADGLRVTADLYETASRNDPVILLFHQSGSSRGEYRRIAPKLVAMGYNALAVDLRWGARDRWNLFRNETAARYGTTEIMAEARSGMRDRVWPTVFAAYEDMLASLDWLGANGFAGPRIVLGSSFSAILVLKMAAEREVAAVLAYSPGEYHDTDTTMVAGWANEVDAPAYVAAGIDEGERVAPVFAALPGPDKLLFQAERGAHGASILLADVTNWVSLESFLSRYAR